MKLKKCEPQTLEFQRSYWISFHNFFNKNHRQFFFCQNSWNFQRFERKITVHSFFGISTPTRIFCDFSQTVQPKEWKKKFFFLLLFFLCLGLHICVCVWWLNVSTMCFYPPSSWRISEKNDKKMTKKKIVWKTWKQNK